MPRRSPAGRALDFLTFPLRAVCLFDRDRCGLSSLRSERFGYVAEEVRGRCLDVGCGPGDRFVRESLRGQGVGIDVFPYAGLSPEQVVQDLRCFPFQDASFDTVTFIASLNHIPRPQRLPELREAHRCLRPSGRIVVTMGRPWAEVAAHKAVALHDCLFGTHHDVDHERGMHHDEALYLREGEIRDLLREAGFGPVRRKAFLTQWGLNALYKATKEPGTQP